MTNQSQPITATIERLLALSLVLLTVAGAVVCLQPECFPTANQHLVK
ncbi:MAG: hypothetical protein WCJ09_25790 [Planctomycetota bacterium]